MTIKEWLEKQLHLPTFLRDFHDQKDLFKSVHWWGKPPQDTYYVSWVNAQCYVTDYFLKFMALHGYTLQKTRTKFEKGSVYEVQETINERKEEERTALDLMFKDMREKSDEEKRKKLAHESDKVTIPPCDY